MKKKLEAELISIAHRILKLKNKSEVIQLHQETQKLYEKLSVLRFVEENFSAAKPTIGLSEIEEKLETVFEDNNDIAVEEPQAETVEEKTETAPEIIEEKEEEIIETSEKTEEPIAAEVLEEAETEVPLIEFDKKTDVEANAEISKEDIEETPESKKPNKQISLEDLLSGVHSDPVFERVHKSEKVEENVEAIVEEKAEEIPEEETTEIEEVPSETETPLEILEEDTSEEEEILEEETFEEEVPSENMMMESAASEEKPANQGSKKTITFGLNDRVAFEKHLFGGNSEDLNRVISQLSTYDTFEEAQDFIEDMVKPDYHNWEGKEDYAMRFMDIVEKKFS